MIHQNHLLCNFKHVINWKGRGPVRVLVVHDDILDTDSVNPLNVFKKAQNEYRISYFDQLIGLVIFKKQRSKRIGVADVSICRFKVVYC